MEQAGKNSQTIKEDMHVMINNAIYDMDEVVSHAEEVLNKIVNGGAPSPLKEGCGRTESTLASVLNNAPQTIRDKNAELHDLLTKISETLF